MEFLSALANNGIIQFIGIFCVVLAAIGLSFIVDVYGGIFSIGFMVFIFSGGDSFAAFDRSVLWVLAVIAGIIAVGLDLALGFFTLKLIFNGEKKINVISVTEKAFVSSIAIIFMLIISCGTYGFFNDIFNGLKKEHEEVVNSEFQREMANLLPICKATNLEELKASKTNMDFVSKCERFFKESEKLNATRQKLGIPLVNNN